MGIISASSSYKYKPVKVLCFYRAWHRSRGGTITFTDSVMIQVRRSDDIIESFTREMKRRYSVLYDHIRIGPHPTVYELVAYIPENGRAKFNVFRN